MIHTEETHRKEAFSPHYYRGYGKSPPPDSSAPVLLGIVDAAFDVDGRLWGSAIGSRVCDKIKIIWRFKVPIEERDGVDDG